jgi:preprotein translocase subunit SecF
MEFFRIHKDIPFMRHALKFNVISLITFLLAVVFLFTKGCTCRSNSPAAR